MPSYQFTWYYFILCYPFELDIGQYRIKNYCHIDPSSINTSDYSIFQIELLDAELQRYYQGRFILEVWTKSGERLFQRILKEECTQWKVYSNVFIFKSSSDSPLIYVMWLHERKMIAVKHPFEDCKEVDLIYFDQYLIVANHNIFKFCQIYPSEVNNQLSQYQNQDENLSPMIEKEFLGFIPQEKILGLVPNPTKHELIFICSNEQHQIKPMKFTAHANQQKLLDNYLPEGPSKKGAVKLDKRMKSLAQTSNEPINFQVIVRNQVPYLLVVRRNEVFEVLENFFYTVYIEQIPKFRKLLQSIGDRVTFQFEDHTINQASNFSKLNERQLLSEQEYYRQMMIPSQSSPSLHELHRSQHFYSDMVIVNQTVFFLRDNIIFVFDSLKKKIVTKVFAKQKVVGLYKLKQSNEDNIGYKTTTYKVVIVHRNGSLIVLVPIDQIYMIDWQKQDLANTPMLDQKNTVVYAFQNQHTQSYLYISTLTQAGEQKLYQMMFNTQIIEVNLKLAKGDNAYSVNATSRSRELLGILDQKYFSVYKNDKGNLVKLFAFQLSQTELKDVFADNTIFFFQRDYLQAICQDKVYRIKTGNSQVEQVNMQDMIHGGGHCFLDAQFYYFLTKGTDDDMNMAIMGSDMIDAAFIQNTNQIQNAIGGEKDKQMGSVKINYPKWGFNNNGSIKRLEYDECNSVINLLLSNFEIIQVPLYHRNTVHFMGMTERQNYLSYKQHGDLFYALDKLNFLSCWQMSTGQMVSKHKLIDRDYSKYEVNRKVYDKNWFKYTLIQRPKNEQDNNADHNINIQASYFEFKIIEIDDKGLVEEKLTFEHFHQNTLEMHLYFSEDLKQMIEILIPKIKKGKVTYNMYNWSGDDELRKWVFISTLNTSDGQFVEWHQKSLFPYNLNLKTFQQLDKEVLNQYELCKFISTDKVKVLNVQDGIEMIFNVKDAKLESFLSLLYSFQSTKESFYDWRCGQFFVQEVTLRLQNFYESLRREMLLYNNKKDCEVRVLDVSTKNFKYKYLIEQSFTWFDYQFYNQHIKDNQKHMIKVFKQMSNDHINRLVHNVFPEKNNTILHLIAESNFGYEIVDYLQEISKKEGFVIPFLINSEEITPLDIMLQRKDHKQVNSLIRMLSKTPMDHHSRFISHLMPKLIELGVTSLEKYFDKRVFHPELCNKITLAKIDLSDHSGCVAIPSTLVNDSEESLRKSLTTNNNAKEQQINLEVLDLPLQSSKKEQISQSSSNNLKLSASETQLNLYEIKIVKSLANTDNIDIFNQKSVRAFVDYLWPHSRKLILQNLFLPYLAFILYYMVYLMVLKRLNITQQNDEAFFKFTSEMFVLYDFIFKMILFLGCFYFFYQDFLQIKSFANNKIVLWSYANIFPLIIMIFIIVYDTFIDSNSPQMEKAFYSATAFFIWIRVIHLLKCFTQTAYLIRMGTEILYRMRYLICFIIISIIAFGFTFFFLSDNPLYHQPQQGFEYMFLLMLGAYDSADFNNVYLQILFVMVMCFNVFFVFTTLVALSVQAFTNSDNDAWSNEAYQDKASLIALYSYLLEEKYIRSSSKKYLMIANVTDTKLQKGIAKERKSGSYGDISKKSQSKFMKSLDRKINGLSNKVDKSLKEIQEKLDAQNDRQPRQAK